MLIMDGTKIIAETMREYISVGERSVIVWIYFKKNKERNRSENVDLSNVFIDFINQYPNYKRFPI